MTAAYPLAWPIGWPRTKPRDRELNLGTANRRTVSVTVAESVSRIMRELGTFGVDVRRDMIISTNIQVRLDGLPRSGQRKPDDPGAAVYFTRFGGRRGERQRCVPCDKYASVEQNLAAIAATISALRALERHGSGIMDRAFAGFEALPHLAEDPWYVVLGIPESAPMSVIEKQYKLLRSAYHPDHNGDAAQFDRVQKAYAAAISAKEGDR